MKLFRLIISILFVICLLSQSSRSMEDLDKEYITENGECPICFESLNGSTKKPIIIVHINKKHTFHQACLRKWNKKQIKKKQEPTCPLCNRTIRQKEIETLNIKIKERKNESKGFFSKLCCRSK